MLALEKARAPLGIYNCCAMVDNNAAVRFPVRCVVSLRMARALASCEKKSWYA